MVFKKEEKQDHFWDRLRLYEELPREYQLVTGVALFTSGIALQFVGSAVYRRYFRRIPNSDWVKVSDKLAPSLLHTALHEE